MLVLPGLILPGMTAVFVDNILIRQFEGWLGPMLVGLAATVVVNVALRWLLGAALLRLELRLPTGGSVDGGRPLRDSNDH